MLKFINALAVFTGTIIGVGIFGLPYVASKIGFFPIVFYFIFLGAVVIIMHLLLAKVALGTEKFHRLPGYVGEYLGPKWKKIDLFIFGSGLVGALLAYLIVGGEFLRFLLSPYFGGTALIYTLLFFSVGAFLIFRGIKSISQIELALLLVFFVILAIFFIRALPFINVEHLETINWKFLVLPYGVVLFSLGGLAVLPEIKEMLGDEKEKLKKVIISGLLIAIVFYLFFVFIILGVSGPQTSREAISGFSQAIGNNIVGLGFIFGIITCFTSFLTLGLTLKKVFWYDFNLSKHLSGFIACFLPLFLFLLGLREFIEIIGLTGALALGGDGIFIVFLYRAFLRRKGLAKMNPLIYCLPIFFILGMIFEIFWFVVR
jgi:tyrosine-specific transport protein